MLLPLTQETIISMPHVIKVFAPATVANVAVGYDILGFAIDGPGDDIIIRPGDKPGLHIKSIVGDQNRLPKEVMKNTAGYAAHRLLASIGALDEPIIMEIQKKMPFGSGLGSSAASAVAGAFGVSTYLKTGLEKIDILKFAVEGEEIADGSWHADNVAPSLLGGMVLVRNNETLDCKKIHIPHGLTAVVIYPKVKVLTKDSRDILKKEISLNSHILQSGNLGAFIAGMYTSDYGLIKRSLQDIIIEPQRAHLIPHFYDVKEVALNAGALGFSISGAGPSMFALCDNTLIAENIKEKVKALYKERKIRNKIFISGINHEGAYEYR